MTLYLSPADGGLRLRMVYQRAVFAPERMACFLRHFRHLLEQVAAEPDQPIDAYSLVTHDDSRVLPDPTAPIAEPLQGLVTERFAEASRRAPASVAVFQGARSWTYSATYAQAADIALRLRTRGLQSGDIVAVCGSQSVGLIASMMGVLFSGGVLLPVSTDLPVARKQLMVRETRAKYLLWVGTQLPHRRSASDAGGHRYLVRRSLGSSVGSDAVGKCRAAPAAGPGESCLHLLYVRHNGSP